MKKHIKKILFALLFLSAGFVIGWLLMKDGVDEQKDRDIKNTHQIRQREGYQFINPLYECEVNGEDYLKKYIPFEDSIKERVANEVQSDDIKLAIYFRNLNDGPWFGINEGSDFAPASLLKVPLMVAYLKKSESNPGILSSSLTFYREQDNEIFNAMQQIVPEQKLESGKSYTVEELIQRMIIYSDNESMVLLMDHFPSGELFKIYNDLGVKNPYGKDQTDVLSVKDYASFFRILYNAAYLSKDDSEKALNLLAQPDFKDGIVAGIPAGIVISHKFGERQTADEQYKNQLHDCGIVYYTKYPYLLCIMTKGNDSEKQTRALKDISRITFEEISKNYP